MAGDHLYGGRQPRIERWEKERAANNPHPEAFTEEDAKLHPGCEGARRGARVRVWIGEDGMGYGWDELTEQEQDEEMVRLGRLCIKYGADEWARCPETTSYQYRNTAEAEDIVGLAFAAWCGGDEVD